MTNYIFKYHQRDRFWTRALPGDMPLFVIGPNDTTPEWPKWEIGAGGYDPRCGSCYLNHPHSTAYHQRSIEK